MAQISEKHKFYFLIVMAFVAGLIAYYRFFRTADTGGKQKPVAEISDQQSGPIPTSLAPQKGKNPIKAENNHGRRTISRNIFEPAAPLTAVPPPTSSPAQKAPLDMTLSGTIIGGDLSMAIINNQFVRQGQMVGQYKITRISPDKVYLSSKDDQLCLSVITVSEAITQ